MNQAIITGDIVDSTKMNSECLDWVFWQITQALEIWDKDYVAKSETFRGDSFQSWLQEPNMALHFALIQKTFIRSLNPAEVFTPSKRKKLPEILDARIAIGIGTIQNMSSRLASSNGTAFELSGQLLDKMKGKKQTLAIATDDVNSGELQTLMVLLDAIMVKTTPKQCEVLNLKLLGYTEEEISTRLKINQSAVNQRSISGNWNEIDAAIVRFKHLYTNGK